MLSQVKSISLGLISVVIIQTTSQAQIAPGTGNGAAADIAGRSQLVKTAGEFLVNQAKSIGDPKLRQETLDAISNRSTCIRHRSGLTAAAKTQIVQSLIHEALLDPGEGAMFPGGLLAGVFPPVLNDGTDCAHLPQPFLAAPGSYFHGHHSYPGGLAIHEVNNEVASVHLAEQYRSVVGTETENGLPRIRLDAARHSPEPGKFGIDDDLIIAPPIWHDWAKSIVFQWNADGSEFQEFSFGGLGTADNFGQAGDSRTGAHHIIGIAETMKRGLNPAFVITQASAHSAPTSGNEYKVVNWLRAASILAQIDPIAHGYLMRDKNGDFRLPPLRGLAQIDLLAATPRQGNFLVEYELHNLSDADSNFSEPAVVVVEALLAELAIEFGFNPADIPSYNLNYRNPALSTLTAERLQIIYASQGLNAIRKQLQNLRNAKVIKAKPDQE